LDEDSDPSSSQLAGASRVLNKMTKAWQAYGLQLWKIKQASITPVASTYQYTIGTSGAVSMNRPLRIIEAYRRETSTVVDVSLTKMTREEYFDLSDKDTTGTPVNYYYDPKLINGVLHVWPAPDSTFASNYTIEILYQDPLEDFDASADEADFPQEWLEAVTYGLAIRLAPGTGIGIMERRELKKEANEALALALSFDVEDGSVFFQPDARDSWS